MAKYEVVRVEDFETLKRRVLELEENLGILREWLISVGLTLPAGETRSTLFAAALIGRQSPLTARELEYAQEVGRRLGRGEKP